MMMAGVPGEGTPTLGHVQEVRREWIVRTDEQLARRVQDEEIVHHLNDNKQRNEQIREDFPAAAAVQARDNSIALAEEQIRQKLVENDARLARELYTLSVESKEYSSKRLRNPKNTHIPNGHIDESTPNGDHSIIVENKSSSNKGKRSDKRNSVNGHHKQHRSKISTKTRPKSMEPSTSYCDDTEELLELGRVLGISSLELKKQKERMLQEEEDAKLAESLSISNHPNDREMNDSFIAAQLQERELERFNKKVIQSEKQRIKKSCSSPYSVPRDNIPSTSHQNPDNDYMEPIRTPKNKSSYAYPSKSSYKTTDIPPPVPERINLDKKKQKSWKTTQNNHYMEVLPDIHCNEFVPAQMPKKRTPPIAPPCTDRPRLEEPASMNIIENDEENTGNARNNKKKFFGCSCSLF